MYSYILAIVGKRWADPAAALVYTLLVLAIVYCLFEPQAEFRYLDM